MLTYKNIVFFREMSNAAHTHTATYRASCKTRVDSRAVNRRTILRRPSHDFCETANTKGIQ